MGTAADLMCAIFYVAGKKAAEVRQKNGENSTDKRERQDADGKTEAVGASISDELYYPIFEDKILSTLYGACRDDGDGFEQVFIYGKILYGTKRANNDVFI